MEISYKLEYDPIPQARPRFGKHGVYEPSECKSYKQKIKDKAAAVMNGREPLTGALECLIKVFRKFDPTSPRYGDVDNHCKIILDGMNGVCYRDDRQITECTVKKGKSLTPHIEVTLKDTNIC